MKATTKLLLAGTALPLLALAPAVSASTPDKPLVIAQAAPGEGPARARPEGGAAEPGEERRERRDERRQERGASGQPAQQQPQGGRRDAQGSEPGEPRRQERGASGSSGGPSGASGGTSGQSAQQPQGGRRDAQGSEPGEPRRQERGASGTSGEQPQGGRRDPQGADQGEQRRQERGASGEPAQQPQGEQRRRDQTPPAGAPAAAGAPSRAAEPTRPAGSDAAPRPAASDTAPRPAPGPQTSPSPQGASGESPGQRPDRAERPDRPDRDRPGPRDAGPARDPASRSAAPTSPQQPQSVPGASTAQPDGARRQQAPAASTTTQPSTSQPPAAATTQQPGTSQPPAAATTQPTSPSSPPPAATTARPPAGTREAAPPTGTAQPAPTAQPPAAGATTTTTTTRQGDTDRARQDERFAPGVTINVGRDARIDELRGLRRERTEGGRVIIEEPGDRRIIREGDRTVIIHNESDRFRRVYEGADVRTERRGTENVTIVRRPNGVEIITVLDDDGNLIRRVRREPGRAETVLIENEVRGRPQRTIIEETVELPPPVIRIPREKYVVEVERASQDDLYEAFTAPPVERIDRAYTLDQVRRSQTLRERVRRVDVDTVTFDSGSWTLAEGQIGALTGVAQAIQQALRGNAAEIFLIEGHTDAVGNDVDNLSLSDRRAETVATILSERFQVPAENLTTQGYGEQYLKVNTQAPERENRRVTIRRITPLLKGGGEASNAPR